MIQLRVVVPSDLTPAVLEVLATTSGARFTTAARGVSVDPAGDVITCVVGRGAVAQVLRDLEELGVRERGAIMLTEAEMVLSAELDRPGQRSADDVDAVVWEEVAARTNDEAALTPGFVVLMILAGIIAGIALITNNVILVVGAMIVSPDFGPMAGIAIAVVERRWDRARTSAFALLVGFPLAAASAFVLTLAAQARGLVVLDVLPGAAVSDLVVNINGLTFIVAVCAGTAGIVSLGRAKSGAVVGVLVSVTTIPAAANIGVQLALGRTHAALESVAMLLVNLGGLALGAVITLSVARLRVLRRLRRRRT